MAFSLAEYGQTYSTPYEPLCRLVTVGTAHGVCCTSPRCPLGASVVLCPAKRAWVAPPLMEAGLIQTSANCSGKVLGENEIFWCQALHSRLLDVQADNPAGLKLLQEMGGQGCGCRAKVPCRRVQGPGVNLGATRAGFGRQCQDTAAPARSPLQTEPWAPAFVYEAEHFSSAPPEVCLNKDASSPSVQSPAMPVCWGSSFTILYERHVNERSECDK